MGMFDFITKPQTRWLDPSRVEALWHDYRQVIPAEPQNTVSISPDQLTNSREHIELIERYFQVKPEYKKPPIQRPDFAIGLIVAAALIGLGDIVALHANLLLLVLAIACIAGSFYYIYHLYQPLREYLEPMENYLMRRSLSRDAYQAWLDMMIWEMRELAAHRLNIPAADLERAEREGASANETLIGRPRFIYGFEPHPEQESRSHIDIPLFAEKRSPLAIVNFYRRVFGKNNRLDNLRHVADLEIRFKVADHVEYGYGYEHWRDIHYLMVIPLGQALAVYETTVNALDLESLDNTTYEYFYQSVIGLQTRVQGRGQRQRPNAQSGALSPTGQRTTFKLLIGNGVDSPEISTTLPLDETIKALRQAISEMKSRALRQEVASGGRVVPPTQEEMSEYPKEDDVKSNTEGATAEREAATIPAF